MVDNCLTKSIDHFIIEVENHNGRDYVNISRSSLQGGLKPIMFPKGDSAGAAGFLSQLSELFGTGLITIAPPEGSKENKMSAVELKDILDTVRKQSDLVPVVDKDGHVLTTFCNIGLDRILKLCDLPRMVNGLNGQPLMANAMVNYMRNSSSQWEKVDGDVACARASQGILVVAAQANDTLNGHGHVAAVYPAQEEYSGSWGKEVPMLNNIGRPFKDGRFNQVMRASQCFRMEPEYYSVKIRR